MSSNEIQSLYIIGGGRTGASLAFFMLRNGLSVRGIAERNPDRFRFLNKDLNWSFTEQEISLPKIRQADIIFITTRDDHISDVANHLRSLGNHWRNKLILHCSGALPSAILEPLEEVGALTASFHPVYSFATDPRENRHFNEIWFNAEGKNGAVERIITVFPFLESRIIKVDTDQKKAIHLACVFYSNFYVALAQISKELLTGIEIPPQEIFRFFNPLLSSSISQVLEHGPAGALTGPVKRADTDTIRSHLEFIRQNHPELESVYLFLSRKLLSISGLSGKEIARIEQFLQQFEQ